MLQVLGVTLAGTLMLITVLALLFPVFNTCSTSDSEVDDHNPCWNAAPRSRPSSRPRSKPFSQGVLVILEFPRLSLPRPFSLDHNNPPSNPSPSFLFFFSYQTSLHPFFLSALCTPKPIGLPLYRPCIPFSCIFRGSDTWAQFPTFINSSPTPPTPPFLFFLPRKEDARDDNSRSGCANPNLSLFFPFVLLLAPARGTGPHQNAFSKSDTPLL